MSIASSILGVVPGLQATALVGHNIQNMNYYLKPRKRIRSRRMIRTGVTNLMAIPLISGSSQQINLLD